MRTKYNKRRFRTTIMIIILLLCMSIGYSYLLTTLNIEGTSNIKSNTWDVHWENVNEKSGSVTGDQVPIEAHILGDTTQVEYSVILKNPGEYYEFTVDAKNDGSLDAMVSIADTKFYESNGVTQISLPDYLEYSFTDVSGNEVEPNTLLAANTSQRYKVKLKFKDNLDESELPTTDKTIVIRQSITYVQSDEHATPPRITMYSFMGQPHLLVEELLPGEIEIDDIVSLEDYLEYAEFPIFFIHEIIGNIIYTSEIGFIYNNNVYYLKGGENESQLSQKPIFEENKAVLIETLGSANCTTDTTSILCNNQDFTGYASDKGEITLAKLSNNLPNVKCEIKIVNNNYYAVCTRIIH